MLSPKIITGAAYSRATLGFHPAVPENLEFWHFPGSSGPGTARNLARGKPDATAMGNPKIYPGYATFKGSADYLQTEVLDQAEVTHISAIRAPNLPQGIFAYAVGAFDGNDFGANLLISGAQNSPRSYVGQAYGARQINNASTPVAAQLPETSGNEWAFVVSRIGNAYHQINDITHGKTGSASITNPRATPNGRRYRIGSSWTDPAPIVSGEIDVAFSAIYSRCLDAPEINKIYFQAQACLASNGTFI